MKNEQTLVLEPSTNTHTIKGNVKITQNLKELSGMVLECKSKGIVLHGEHGVIATESANVIKLIQQECNPLTGQLQNSFD